MRHLLALILLVTATSAIAQPARVVDGDTLELSTGERIRLWGIDSPESDQVCQRAGCPWRCGDDATAALAALVDGRDLMCTERDVDRYTDAPPRPAAWPARTSAPRWSGTVGRPTSSGTRPSRAEGRCGAARARASGRL